jgi:hypothetical protein
VQFVRDHQRKVKRVAYPLHEPAFSTRLAA